VNQSSSIWHFAVLVEFWRVNSASMHADDAFKPRPVAGTPSTWIRWPYFVVSELAEVALYEVVDSQLVLRGKVALTAQAGLTNGRGSNVLQTAEVTRGGWLVGGTTEHVLAIPMSNFLGDTQKGLTLTAEATGVLTLKGHTKVVTCVRCTADGELLYSCSIDRTARQWALPSGEEGRAHTIPQHAPVYMDSYPPKQLPYRIGGCLQAVELGSTRAGDRKGRPRQ